MVEKYLGGSVHKNKLTWRSSSDFFNLNLSRSKSRLIRIRSRVFRLPSKKFSRRCRSISSSFRRRSRSLLMRFSSSFASSRFFSRLKNPRRVSTHLISHSVSFLHPPPPIIYLRFKISNNSGSLSKAILSILSFLASSIFFSSCLLSRLSSSSFSFLIHWRYSLNSFKEHFTYPSLVMKPVGRKLQQSARYTRVSYAIMSVSWAVIILAKAKLWRLFNGSSDSHLTKHVWSRSTATTEDLPIFTFVL